MPDADAAADPTPTSTPAAAPAPAADEVAAPFEEVLAAGAALEGLDDAARVEAWASSALGVWAEAPDAADHDEDFCRWLAEIAVADDPRARRARLLRAAVSALRPEAEEPRGPGTDADLDAIGEPPAWLGHLGTATATRAWRVVRHGVESVGIGFASSDHSEHSLLADIVDGELAALIVAPGPDELFDGSEDLVAPEPLGVDTAAAAIVDGWIGLASHGTETPESVHVNAAIARARLAAITGRSIDDLRSLVAASPGSGAAQPAGGDAQDGDGGAGTDADDRAETDRWARSVLDGALGAVTGTAGSDCDEAITEVLLDALDPERIRAQPALEREAYGALEWADWLGVVIESVRRGAGTALDADAMVDAVNRCPEVTSSIPRSDRPYYTWAFSLVLALWRRAGVIDDQGRLTPDGVIALPAALRRVWGPAASD